LHDQRGRAQRFEVGERVARHGEQIGGEARRDRADDTAGFGGSA
jgi:hypothetical protein